MRRSRNEPKRKIPPPSIFASPFAQPTDKGSVQLLTAEEQTTIADNSRIVDMRQNTVIYPEGGHAHYVYNIVSGVVETYILLPDGERRITSFLFPSDLLGLSEEGRYTGTAQTITRVIAYKIPITTMGEIVRRDPKMDVALLCKLCHELRRAERHMITSSQRDAQVRVASFVLWLWRSEAQSGANSTEVKVPMLRSDIGDYLGMTKESVSRALLQLETLQLIHRDGPRALTLVDIPGLQRAAHQV
jgi:CRP/FNR family transcriptional regulator, anaerobic regulatory protein